MADYIIFMVPDRSTPLIFFAPFPSHNTILVVRILIRTRVISVNQVQVIHFGDDIWEFQIAFDPFLIRIINACKVN